MSKHFMSLYQQDKQGGYVLLAAVLLVGSLAVSIAVASLILGIDTSKNAIVSDANAQAEGSLISCGTAGLAQVSSSSEFVGGETLQLYNGLCSYNVNDDLVYAKTINVSSSYRGVTRKMLITIDSVDPVVVNSWQDVADF